MPSLLGREVRACRVSVFESSDLDYDRWIRLELEPRDGEPGHVVEIEFPPVAPRDRGLSRQSYSLLALSAFLS